MNTPSQKCFCEKCRKEVAFHYQPVPHRKHALITVCTLGLWLPIWLLLAFARGKVCDSCNEPLWGQ